MCRTQAPDRGVGLGAVTRGLRTALEAAAPGRSQERDSLGTSIELGMGWGRGRPRLCHGRVGWLPIKASPLSPQDTE